MARYDSELMKQAVLFGTGTTGQCTLWVIHIHILNGLKRYQNKNSTVLNETLHIHIPTVQFPLIFRCQTNMLTRFSKVQVILCSVKNKVRKSLLSCVCVCMSGCKNK